jgi:SSS family solute:Na+ symporter
MAIFASFLFFTGLVGLITYLRTRNEDLRSRRGYFLAGRSLNGWVIAGSLLLTNLSAANFTGMTALVYGGNLAPIAWTVTVIPPLVFFAGLILPVFLRNGYATIPEYLERRYGPSTRRLVTALFLFCYILGGMPVALYGGAIAFIHLFGVPTLLGVSETASVWIVVWALGTIGGVYALFGGLKGVAVSDTLNGAGLLIGGALVFWFGVRAVGNSDFLAGGRAIFTTETWKLDAIGNRSDGIPFSVLFTGMLLHNMFYWCANQFIVQRCFGARSLREGQKGVLLAGFFKILNVFYIALPGVIAFHLYGPDRFDNDDWVYPTLVRDVMPGVLAGFFAAIIFGTVLSTYNSVLNSSITIFALDLYKPFRPDSADETVIRHSKIVGGGLVLLTMIVAPLIMSFEGGIFQYMVKTEILFGSPIFLTVLAGYLSKTVSARAANLTLVSYLATLVLFQFVIAPPVHFLHLLAGLFLAHVLLLLGLTRVYPQTRPPQPAPDAGEIDLRPWKHFSLVSGLAVAAAAMTYVLFSPWGLVRNERAKDLDLGLIVTGVIFAIGFFLMIWRLQRRVMSDRPREHPRGPKENGPGRDGDIG